MSNRVGRLLLVVDIGNTLVDLRTVSLNALRQMGLTHLSQQSLQRLADPFRGPTFSYFFLNQQIVAALFPHSTDIADRTAEYRRIALRLLRGANARMAIAKLADEHTVLIATNGSIESTSAILEALDIATIVPEAHRYVSEQFGVLKQTGRIHMTIRAQHGPGPAVCVGDSVDQDLVPGAAAGMVPIWVTGYLAATTPPKTPPAGTRRIASIAELPSLLASLPWS